MTSKKSKKSIDTIVEATKIIGLKMPGVQVFHLYRTQDESGVSGTGIVGDGVVFPNGWCFFVWRSATAGFEFFQTFEQFKFIHVDSHPTNGSVFRFSKIEENQDVE